MDTGHRIYTDILRETLLIIHIKKNCKVLYIYSAVINN